MRSDSKAGKPPVSFNLNAKTRCSRCRVRSPPHTQTLNTALYTPRSTPAYLRKQCPAKHTRSIVTLDSELLFSPSIQTAQQLSNMPNSSLQKDVGDGVSGSLRIVKENLNKYSSILSNEAAETILRRLKINYNMFAKTKVFDGLVGEIRDAFVGLGLPRDETMEKVRKYRDSIEDKSAGILDTSDGPDNFVQAFNEYKTPKESATASASSSEARYRNAAAASSSSGSQVNLQKLFSQIIDRLKEDTVLGDDLTQELSNPSLAKELANAYNETINRENLDLFRKWLSQIDNFTSDGRKVCEAALLVLHHWHRNAPSKMRLSPSVVKEFIDKHTEEIGRDEFNHSFECEVVSETGESFPFSEYYRKLNLDRHHPAEVSVARSTSPGANASTAQSSGASTATGRPTASAPPAGTSATNGSSIRSQTPATGMFIPGLPSSNNGLSQTVINTPTVAPRIQPIAFTVARGASAVGANTTTSVQNHPVTSLASTQGLTHGTAVGSSGSAPPNQVVPIQSTTTPSNGDIDMKDPDAPADDPKEKPDEMEGVESPGPNAAAPLSQSQGATLGNGSAPSVQAVSTDIEMEDGESEDTVMKDADASDPAIGPGSQAPLLPVTSASSFLASILECSDSQRKFQRWDRLRPQRMPRRTNLPGGPAVGEVLRVHKRPQRIRTRCWATNRKDFVSVDQEASSTVVPTQASVSGDNNEPTPTATNTMGDISNVDDEANQGSPVDQQQSIPTAVSVQPKTPDSQDPPETQDAGNQSEEPVPDVHQETAAEGENIDVSSPATDEQASTSTGVAVQLEASGSQDLPQTDSTSSQSENSVSSLVSDRTGVTIVEHHPLTLRRPDPEGGYWLTRFQCGRPTTKKWYPDPAEEPRKATPRASPADFSPEYHAARGYVRTAQQDSLTTTTGPSKTSAEKTVPPVNDPVSVLHQEETQTGKEHVSPPVQQEEHAQTIEDTDASVGTPYPNSEASNDRSGHDTTPINQAHPLLTIVGYTVEGFELPNQSNGPIPTHRLILPLLTIMFIGAIDVLGITLKFGLRCLQSAWEWVLTPVGKGMWDYAPTIRSHIQGAAARLSGPLCKTVAAGWNYFRPAQTPRTLSPATPRQPSVLFVRQQSFAARLQSFHHRTSVPVAMQPSPATSQFDITPKQEDRFSDYRLDPNGCRYLHDFYGEDARRARALRAMTPESPLRNSKLWDDVKPVPTPRFS
ncbi:hypothetical protein P171DRAFT_507285 [Karstenula rhodostoma CBS 690.94]|uniref:Uncharacterized protein n=1 Tax=Karstenula rhodostoma CBS 690.94 TaxID=1392251 RepID=A0A9P4UGY3_9PLEO|nr:hypothetical protein P171DRAFT_507285 [Karstenula rhodostoma CBS 690.94]